MKMRTRYLVEKRIAYNVESFPVRWLERKLRSLLWNDAS
jgi:hypothetical protein